ncbi:hypothetical protein DXU07_33260 [Bradyrhizobium elkanii]|nr:hypothetical protein BLN97_25205 [Bradyrhizobium elkanii]GEC56917.1 hypothetical protein BEL01nite_59600 [Bradyrhizobium elkanii]
MLGRAGAAAAEDIADIVISFAAHIQSYAVDANAVSAPAPSEPRIACALLGAIMGLFPLK